MLKYTVCKNLVIKARKDPMLLYKVDMARGSWHVIHAELRPKQRQKSLIWYCQSKIHLATPERSQHFSKQFQPYLPLFEDTVIWWLLT